MTIVDLIKDFIDTTKERLKTPISGAFLWSFIIYNWRPILVLIYSNASIEDKIIVINHEYCDFWAIFWPVVFATFYTLLMPKITLEIDENLAETKNKRVTKLYEEEKHKVIQKTNVAKEEFILKSEESGKQTIQEFMSQIEGLKSQNNTLQESIKQINESNKVTIEGLNNSLKPLKDSISSKDQEIARLTKIHNLYLDNAPSLGNFPQLEINLEMEYDKIIKKTLNASNLPPDLVVKTGMIADILSIKEYKFLKQLIINNKNELVIGHQNEPGPLESLIAKSVIAKREKRGLTIFVLTEVGSVIRDILVND